MKKLLLLVAFATIGITNSFSQVCTANVSCLPQGSAYGLCPDSTTGIATGCVNVPYSQVVSMKVPNDAGAFGQPSTTLIDYIRIDSVVNLAPGLTWACNPSDNKFQENSNGCILISGTPTQVWNKQITVYATARVLVFGVAPVTQQTTNKQYFSVVHNCTGVGEAIDYTKFEVFQNAPNPFNEKTEINFVNNNNNDIDFIVYNVVGAKVYGNKFKTSTGLNTITIDANSFSPGVYFYTIYNGTESITKRMVVSNK